MEGPRRAEELDGAPAWFGEPSFGQRLLAMVVDVLLLLVFAFLLVQVPIGLGVQRSIMTVAAAAYIVLSTVLTGRTVGKRVVGLRIVDVATGRLPDLRAAVLRWAVPALPLFVGWVSPTVASYVSWFSFAVFVPILKGPQHRGIHDLVAGTIVTRVVD